MLISSILGVYAIVQRDNYITGTILCLGGVYLSYVHYKNVTNRLPQIVLNNEGIKTINTKFYNWEDVFDENVDNSGNNDYYLVYGHLDGIEILSIDHYDIGHKELLKLLRVYKGRSLTKK